MTNVRSFDDFDYFEEGDNISVSSNSSSSSASSSLSSESQSSSIFDEKPTEPVKGPKVKRTILPTENFIPMAKTIVNSASDDENKTPENKPKSKKKPKNHQAGSSSVTVANTKPKSAKKKSSKKSPTTSSGEGEKDQVGPSEPTPSVRRSPKKNKNKKGKKLSDQELKNHIITYIANL